MSERLIAYSVIESGKEDGKPYWHDIGTAFINDGNVKLLLNSLPLTREIVMMAPKASPKAAPK